MPKRTRKVIVNRFFCAKCGNEGIPLARKICMLKEEHHRKKIFCLYCKEQVNHVECRNDLEVNEFKENFQDGMYQKEVEDFIIEESR